MIPAGNVSEQEPEGEHMRPTDSTAAADQDTAAPEKVPLMGWLRAGAGARASDATNPGFTGTDATAGPAEMARPGAATDLATDEQAGWPDDPDALAEGDALAGADSLAEVNARTEPSDLAGADGPAGGGVVLTDLNRALNIDAGGGGDSGDQWAGILTMFVDDPRGSVLEAAAMVDEAIDAFIATVRERQESLASSWEAKEAGTEELRLALQGYRMFWSSLADLRQSA